MPARGSPRAASGIGPEVTAAMPRPEHLWPVRIRVVRNHDPEQVAKALRIHRMDLEQTQQEAAQAIAESLALLARVKEIQEALRARTQALLPDYRSVPPQGSGGSSVRRTSSAVAKSSPGSRPS